MSQTFEQRAESFTASVHDATRETLVRLQERVEREIGTRLLVNITVSDDDTPESAADRLLDAVFARYRLVPREKS